MLWDTAGQEEFDAITKAYYRGAQACVVAFSTVDRASFEAVRRWKKKVGTTLPKTKVHTKNALVPQLKNVPSFSRFLLMMPLEKMTS